MLAYLKALIFIFLNQASSISSMVSETDLRIWFDHPPQDFTYPAVNGTGRVIFAIRLTKGSGVLSSFDQIERKWADYQIALEVNAGLAGTWPALDFANIYGEVRSHIEVGAFPIGEHVATCRLLKGQEDIDIEHTISFHVGETTLGKTDIPESGNAGVHPTYKFLLQLLSLSIVVNLHS